MYSLYLNVYIANAPEHTMNFYSCDIFVVISRSANQQTIRKTEKCTLKGSVGMLLCFVCFVITTSHRCVQVIAPYICTTATFRPNVTVVSYIVLHIREKM